MIRQGLVCKRCTDSECQDIGTEREPLEIECPACSGQGCDKCDEGFIGIEGCPNRFCREIATTAGLVDLFEKGLPPIAGGALDQSVWFVEAAKILQDEESAIRSEKYAD